MGKMTKVLKTCLTGIFVAVVIVTFGIVAANVTKATEASAEAEAATYLADGWSEYGGESVSEGAGGIVMESGAAGYSFSNTTKKAYNTDNLSVSFRLKDYIYDPSGAVTNFFIGFTPTDENFAAEDGSSYGVALISHTDNATFNAWFVQRDKNATAITGYNNLALVGGNDVKLTDTGVMTITFHREGDGQWYVWLNGIYQITVPTDCNATLTAQAQSHVAIVATDTLGEESTQTAKLEVVSVASDVLGTLNGETHINNRIAGSSYDVTENGVVFESTSLESGADIVANVNDSLTGNLDGAVFSIKKNIVNVSSYDIDLGFGTNHGAGRFTFWDSRDDVPTAVGNVGIRISSNNTVIFLLMARSATEGYESVARTGLYVGALPVPLNVANEYIVQFLKINGEWHVIINGRRIFSTETPDSGAFQTYFTAVMESVNNAAGENVSPWIQVYSNSDKAEGFSANVTVKGYGTQRWGKIPDANEGVIGDEITGTLEFNRNEWTSITPSGTSVDVRITDKGFVLKGKNSDSGFNAGMNYKSAITQLDGYSVTVAMPQKILRSAGAVKGWYGMFIGDNRNSNFSEINSVYIRWRYENSDSSASVATGDLIVWDKVEGEIKSVPFNIPAKTANERVGEVTVRFYFDGRNYRVYINGERASSPSLEAILTEHLDAMTVKYLTVNASYEIDGGGSAWGNNDADIEMQEITVVSICGKKVVNEVPELVTASIDVEVAATHNSVMLTWSKAEYKAGYLDSYNFTPTGYVIERYNMIDESPERTVAVGGGIDVLAFTDTGLNANTRYFYTVYAVDDHDNRLMASGKKQVTTLESQGGDGINPDPTDSETNPDPTGPEKDSETKSAGCGGSVGSSVPTTCLFAIATLAVVALFRRKRQK